MAATTPKYASKEHIQKVFAHCLEGDWDGFFAWVVPDVREYSPSPYAEKNERSSPYFLATNSNPFPRRREAPPLFFFFGAGESYDERETSLLTNGKSYLSVEEDDLRFSVPVTTRREGGKRGAWGGGIDKKRREKERKNHL